MVRIRLRRVGAKKQPSYRIVVADARSPRDGRFIEVIGFYNPRTDPPTIEIQEDRARYWLSVGAQPSEPAARLLRKLGILGGGVEPQQEAVAPEPEEKAPQEEPKVEPEPEAELEAEPEDEEEATPEAEEEAAQEEEPEPEAEPEEEVPAEGSEAETEETE